MPRINSNVLQEVANKIRRLRHARVDICMWCPLGGGTVRFENGNGSKVYAADLTPRQAEAFISGFLAAREMQATDRFENLTHSTTDTDPGYDPWAAPEAWAGGIADNH